ncbi:MAG: hypothetical protein JSV46_10960 [Candidatus Aminicenantes bacterium]|nr:MAG: hypothetical protein JSV46_10960 [Candidatus Aminicenantes bacterium]
MGNKKEPNVYDQLKEIMEYEKYLPDEEREEFLRKGTALHRTIVKVCESLRAIMIPDPERCPDKECPFCPPECPPPQNPWLPPPISED